MTISRCMPSLRIALLIPVLSLVGSGVALPQKAGGQIRGVVRDSGGAIVTVGVVTVQNEHTGWTSEATLDMNGEFVFRPVPDGTYRFEVLSPGFKRYARRGIVVDSQGTPKVVAKLEAGPIAGVLATLGGGHVVLGYGWNDVGYANWSHTYAVLVTPRGRVIGKVKVSFIDVEAPEYSLDYTNDVECVEIDAATSSAWLGGHISKTSNPSYIPLGTYVVDFARDGGRGNTGDFHGDALPGLDGQPETCHERYGPYYMDPVERGNIIVK